MSDAAPPSLLRHAPFLRLVSARFLASFGVQMISTAVGVQVYDLTQKPRYLALVGLAVFAPMIALTLPAGRLADARDRRSIAAVCNLLFAFVGAALFALSRVERPPLAAMYACLVLLGVGRAFYGPAAAALLPMVVPPGLLSRAVAVQSTSWQIAALGGPALAGAIYTSARSPAPVYAIAAVGCLLGCGLMLAMRSALPLTASQRPPVEAEDRRDVAVGLRYVLGHPLLLPALLLDFLAVFLGGATALIPMFARDILHGDPSVAGMLRAAPGVGAAVVALVLARVPVERHTGAVLLTSVGLFGLGTVGFGLSRDLGLSLAALAFLGAADMVSAVLRGTMVQLATPSEIRGRVSAVNHLFISASNELGEFESGLAAEAFGPVLAVVGGGVGTVVVVLFCALRFPRLRDLDRLQDAAPDALRQIGAPAAPGAIPEGDPHGSRSDADED